MNESGKSKQALYAVGTVFLSIATLLLIVLGISYIKEYQYIGASAVQNATIAVSGEGEVLAVPDTAEFSLAVREEADTVPQAQKLATEKTNKVVSTLKTSGIDEKDIKTTNYSINPRYEYHQDKSGVSGKRVLVGYNVSQSIQVKVRDTDKAGSLLSKVGQLGVENVSGLSFTIDDQEAIQEEARGKAIKDAQEKAQKLSKDLGVRLVGIVDFSESGASAPQPMYMKQGMVAMESSAAGSSPSVPVGQNEFTSHVTITYKIK